MELEEEKLEQEVVVQAEEEIDEVVHLVECAEGDEGGIEGGSCLQGLGQVRSLPCTLVGKTL